MFKKSANRTVVVSNPQGLHARPCLAIVNALRGLSATVKIRNGKQVVDATSILQLMTLAATEGTELVLLAKGPDADKALDALTELFACGFDGHLDQ
jgi:phosphocarrier protein